MHPIEANDLPSDSCRRKIARARSFKKGRGDFTMELYEESLNIETFLEVKVMEVFAKQMIFYIF